jgi:hypothetical protein
LIFRSPTSGETLSYRVVIKGSNMPTNLPATIPPQRSISSELEALRRVEILGQPALPAVTLLPDLHA